MRGTSVDRLAVVLLAVVLLVSPIAAQEPSPSALYDRGVVWSEFFARVQSQQQRWRTNTERAAPSTEMVERLRAAGAGLRILVIGEAACSDSVSTMPYVAKLAEQAGVDLRIVGKSAGLPLMEQHRTPDNRPATPTIVLLRGDRIAAVFVERPAALQTWFLSPAARAMDSAERLSRKMSWYDWDRGDSTIAEIVALAEVGRSEEPVEAVDVRGIVVVDPRVSEVQASGRAAGADPSHNAPARPWRMASVG
jgi:hypothetical protein